MSLAGDPLACTAAAAGQGEVHRRQARAKGPSFGLRCGLSLEGGRLLSLARLPARRGGPSFLAAARAPDWKSRSTPATSAV